MNRNLSAFIEDRKRAAEERGLSWDMALDEMGRASKSSAWDLTSLTGSVPPPNFRLRDFGYEAKAREVLNENRRREKLPELLLDQSVPEAWQDLIKAVAIDGCVMKRNKANHVLNQVIRPLRVIATAAEGTPPADLTREHVESAIALATEIQPSGLLGQVTASVVRHVIDHLHLADRSPLLPPKESNRSGRQTNSLRDGPVKAKAKKAPERRSLSARRDAHRLPSQRAFWELIRIVFTENPQSLVDALRFAQVKVLILTGLRIGEVTSLPLDWKQTRDYVAADGRPAGAYGGISHSIALNYFGEKQGAHDQERQLFYPQLQHIPSLFEDILEETLRKVERITEPLRSTYARQNDTHRLLPDFSLEQLVPVCELFPYLSGNPLLYEDPACQELITEYNRSFDPALLEEIEGRQVIARNQGAKLRNEVRVYFTRMRRDIEHLLPCLSASGSPSLRMNYVDGHFRIADVEAFIRKNMPTKIASNVTLKTTEGTLLGPHEFLFIAPKRALIAERNGGVCDIRKYFSVSRWDPADIMRFLGDVSGSKGGDTIFKKYAERDEDRNLRLNTHSLRHLQNTELFRLGIADTIITKRYGRRSVAQSYEYDHRTLAEELDSVSIPPAATAVLPDKAREIFQLIESGNITGPLVTEFRHIQASEGDESAFEFLAAEADGFHSTPYGYCTQSFAVEPCPKHLECFNGCRHLTATALPEHRVNLERLQSQLREAITRIEDHPADTIGRSNQLAHAHDRLAGLETVLETAPDAKPFPAGPDLSLETGHDGRSVLDA